MAHNYEASSSHDGCGYARPMNLNAEEVQILADNKAALKSLELQVGSKRKGDYTEALEICTKDPKESFEKR
jgi:hypothetical protein